MNKNIKAAKQLIRIAKDLVNSNKKAAVKILKIAKFLIDVNKQNIYIPRG